MLVGTTLRNRYKILRPLGSGGFGDTYIAEDTDLPGRPSCVVKHLKAKSSNPAVLPIVRRLFENEAQVLYSLGNEHDQIPRLFAHFEEDQEFYLVQEFIDGYDLTHEILSGQRLSETAVIQLLQEILEVLAFVHQRQIIHRDLKPQNIMRRRRDGKLVLIDFGAVKELGTIAVNTQGQVTSTIVVGTPGYMPTEQASGHPKLCSDIYAVGLIGIQALTGIEPQMLPTDPDSLEVIWQDRAKVSNAQLADVLTTMVRYHFSQRFPSAKEALQALQQTIVIPTPTPTPAPVPLPVPGSKIPWKVVVSMSAAAVVVAITSVVAGQAIKSALSVTPSPSPTVTPTVTNSYTPSPSPTETASPSPSPTKSSFPLSGRTRQTINFPDGRKYVGEVRDGKPDGSGVMTYVKGDVYTGEFKDGLPNGRGAVNYINGRKYEGEIKDNYLNGRGVMTYANGDRYEGEFKEDVPSGKGVFTYVTGARYEGDFKNGKANGQGIYYYTNGDRFEGEYKDDQPNGKGIYIYANGTRKTGTWVDGKVQSTDKSTEKSNNAAGGGPSDTTR